jgi:hypothetical protein
VTGGRLLQELDGIALFSNGASRSSARTADSAEQHEA